MPHPHLDAPTRYVEANGTRYAYRRFGATDGDPLVFPQHFTGTMDSWDPSVVGGFARERPVVLFDFEELRDARLVLYPDSGHGALFQYADALVGEGLRFLAAPDPRATAA